MAAKGFLKKVIDLKHQEVHSLEAKIPLNAIREKAEYESAKPGADFLGALQKRGPSDIGIIAEIKKASPSKGEIRPDLDPSLFAKNYTRAGACAISVLTESHFFKGSLKDLEAVRAATHLPILRKDFTISSYQIYEARASGANSVLLITTILSPGQLKGYIELAREINMEPLVEINSESEFEIAAKCNATCIGINNRNLQTLETDLNVSRRLSPLFYAGQVPVEASGISSRKDIDHGLESNFFNFLVGESIVRADDTIKFIRELIGTNPPSAPAEQIELKKKNNRPLVKICGLTDPVEALECARLGADAIGLVFYEKSPRNVSVGKAAQICNALPQHVITIGVFVDEPYESIMETVNACSLKAVQLHGRESPELVEKLSEKGLIVIKALFCEKKPFMHDAGHYPHASAFLVEHGKGTLPGGNAEQWNWERAKEMDTAMPLILAGGLSPDTIDQVVQSVLPDMVDVSSGVEQSPGRKDLNRVKAFINKVK